jgi:hypothetical protein
VVTARQLARRLGRVVVLVLAFVGARQVLGVWPSSVLLAAGCLWLVLRVLRRLDARPTPPRRVLTPDVIYLDGRAPSADRHMAFARALAVVAAAYQCECELEASQR